MGRRCLRSAMDATSEVEMRDRIRDLVIGVFAKPDASILRFQDAQRRSDYARYFVMEGARQKNWTDFDLTCINWIRGSLRRQGGPRCARGGLL
jgi:hypothetical protein